MTTCTTNSSVTGYCTSCNPPTGCTTGFQCDAYSTSPCASGYCCATLTNSQSNTLLPWKVCLNGLPTDPGYYKTYANVSGQMNVGA